MHPSMENLQFCATTSFHFNDFFINKIVDLIEYWTENALDVVSRIVRMSTIDLRLRELQIPTFKTNLLNISGTWHRYFKLILTCFIKRVEHAFDRICKIPQSLIESPGCQNRTCMPPKSATQKRFKAQLEINRPASGIGLETTLLYIFVYSFVSNQILLLSNGM